MLLFSRRLMIMMTRKFVIIYQFLCVSIDSTADKVLEKRDFFPLLAQLVAGINCLSVAFITMNNLCFRYIWRGGMKSNNRNSSHNEPNCSFLHSRTKLVARTSLKRGEDEEKQNKQRSISIRIISDTWIGLGLLQFDSGKSGNLPTVKRL